MEHSHVVITLVEHETADKVCNFVNKVSSIKDWLDLGNCSRILKNLLTNNEHDKLQRMEWKMNVNIQN